MSQLTDVPVCDWIHLGHGWVPMVALQGWVMPKDCFIMLWFWFMSNGKVYHKHWDHDTWNQVLMELNPAPDSKHQNYKDHVLTCIHDRLVSRIMQDSKLDEKYDIFTRVITQLQESEPQTACACA
jgi:hypothetical protein